MSEKITIIECDDPICPVCGNRKACVLSKCVMNTIDGGRSVLSVQDTGISKATT
jgi:hypothetical protein